LDKRCCIRWPSNSERCPLAAFAFSANDIGAGDLLAEHGCWPALADEIEEFRPEVAFVGGAESLAGAGEWLAGTGAGPDGAVSGPPGELQGLGPPRDPAEEMALGKSVKINWLHVADAPLVNFAGGNKSG